VNARVEVNRRLAELASTQYGLITRAQLGEIGARSRQIDGWLAAHRLVPVLPSVFRVTGAPRSHEQMLMAATLWAGAEARVSHRSAAGLWSIDCPAPARPEITVPASVLTRSAPVKVHHSRSKIEPRRTRADIPDTSPERTIIDLAGVLSAPQLEIAFESARHQRLLTVASVRHALDDLGARGRRGSASLQALLSTLADEPAAESALEVRVARLLRATDLPRPRRQVDVVVNGRRYRLDFAWPEFLLALECDGRKWHEFERDRRRWSAITAATGYRIVWATWARLRDEPDRLIDEIRRRVSHRGGGLDARSASSAGRTAG
jgi:very-short-patch-repair endonuclease